MIRKIFFAGLAALLMATGANAATILGIYLDPPTTAGAGSTSTRSGAGSFHLYGADDTAGSQGIATYSITLGPAVTASNNRAPVTTIQDSNGDSQSAGFNLLRSSSNVNPMTGAENLPGQTPFLIKGFGQTTGNFTNIAAGAPQPASVVGPTTSGSWGGPYVGGALVDLAGSTGQKKWVLLGEGTYNPALLGPNLTTALAAMVPSATTTVYSSGTAGDFSQSAATTTIIFVPEPATISLLGLAMVGCFGMIRRRS